MRLVTWNCYRGDCHDRAGEVEHLAPDVVVLQECGRPAEPSIERCVWFGDNPRQGVAVAARGPYHLESVPIADGMTHSVFPVRVVGPATFALLAVWALPRPTYVRAVDAGLTAYRDMLLEGPAIVAGDFNSHWRWDRRGQNMTHAALVGRLEREFGMVSAYHAAKPGVAHGREEPTLYWQWKREQSFHIDYCFMPGAWVPHIASVAVGTCDDWNGKSDHRPLVVEVLPPATTAVADSPPTASP